MTNLLEHSRTIIYILWLILIHIIWIHGNQFCHFSSIERWDFSTVYLYSINSMFRMKCSLIFGSGDFETNNNLEKKISDWYITETWSGSSSYIFFAPLSSFGTAEATHFIFYTQIYHGKYYLSDDRPNTTKSALSESQQTNRLCL